jgi:hypothetical protein
MAIIKRRLDICGREKVWEYHIDASGRDYYVNARQIGRDEPLFTCSCGVSTEGDAAETSFFGGLFNQPCVHIAEAQRDLSLARQAAAQMVP